MKPTFQIGAFAEAIVRIAKSRGMTMREVATMTGVNDSTLSRMKDGTRIPNAAAIAALSAWASINPARYSSLMMKDKQ